MTQPDPLEVESTVTTIASGNDTTPHGANAAPVDLTNADLHLFGEDLYAAFTKGAIVRLDNTVDRTLFRNQRDRLKQVGYRFDSREQFWFLPN